MIIVKLSKDNQNMLVNLYRDAHKLPFTAYNAVSGKTGDIYYKIMNGIFDDGYKIILAAQLGNNITIRAVLDTKSTEEENNETFEWWYENSIGGK